MNIQKLIGSRQAQGKVQLVVLPLLVASITSLGASGLTQMVGEIEALLLVGALISLHIYIIASNIRFDIRGAIPN